MEQAPDYVLEMPEDLQECLAQNPNPNVFTGRQPQTNLRTERISGGSFFITVFFPVFSDGRMKFSNPVADVPMTVMVMYPGGLDAVVDGDHNFAAHLVEKTGCIVAAVDRRSAVQEGIVSIKGDSHYALALVRDRCGDAWKTDWDTDPDRVCLVAISFGAVPAIDVALSVRDTQPVLGLILIVPVLDTNPRTRARPWGKYENTPGLDLGSYLSKLDEAFKDVSRDAWHDNPSMLPDFLLSRLPPTHFILAQYDPLCETGVEFAERMGQKQRSCVYEVYKSIHQVKDLEDTAEGQRVRRNVAVSVVTLITKGGFQSCQVTDKGHVTREGAPQAELPVSSQDLAVYYCIYEHCTKSFRTKEAWQCHDIENHDAQDYWICQEEPISHSDGQSGTCHDISYNRTLHETHLRKHHKISSEDLVKERVTRNWISAGHQPQFFCGFCSSPVQRNQGAGKEAWYNRFDHLSLHMRRGDTLRKRVHEHEVGDMVLNETLPD